MAYRKSTREILEEIYDRYEDNTLNEAGPSGNRVETYEDGMAELRFFMRNFVGAFKKMEEYVLSKYSKKEVAFLQSKYAVLLKDLARILEEDPKQDFNNSLAEELSDLIVMDYLKEVHNISPKKEKS